MAAPEKSAASKAGRIWAGWLGHPAGPCDWDWDMAQQDGMAPSASDVADAAAVIAGGVGFVAGRLTAGKGSDD